MLRLQGCPKSYCYCKIVPLLWWNLHNITPDVWTWWCHNWDIPCNQWVDYFLSLFKWMNLEVSNLCLLLSTTGTITSGVSQHSNGWILMLLNCLWCCLRLQILKICSLNCARMLLKSPSWQLLRIQRLISLCHTPHKTSEIVPGSLLRMQELKIHIPNFTKTVKYLLPAPKTIGKSSFTLSIDFIECLGCCFLNPVVWALSVQWRLATLQQTSRTQYLCTKLIFLQFPDLSECSLSQKRLQELHNKSFLNSNIHMSVSTDLLITYTNSKNCSPCSKNEFFLLSLGVLGADFTQ